MKETFYFSHDYNARNDEKIKSIIRKFKMEGYGLYWSIIEDLYQNANALRLDIEGIAFDYHTTENVVNFVINESGLFNIEDGIISSRSVGRRLEERALKSKKAKESAEKRWNNNANALQTQSEPNAIKESKVKESKINNKLSKDNKELALKKREDIDLLISNLKQQADILGISYDKKQERNFGKHIMTAKGYGEFCEKIGLGRIEFAKNIMVASDRIKFWKGVCAGPMSIYQNYSEVYNLTKSKQKGSEIINIT